MNHSCHVGHRINNGGNDEGFNDGTETWRRWLKFGFTTARRSIMLFDASRGRSYKRRFSRRPSDVPIT
jgi:hypothetical protein